MKNVFKYSHYTLFFPFLLVYFDFYMHSYNFLLTKFSHVQYVTEN